MLMYIVMYINSYIAMYIIEQYFLRFNKIDLKGEIKENPAITWITGFQWSR